MSSHCTLGENIFLGDIVKLRIFAIVGQLGDQIILNMLNILGPSSEIEQRPNNVSPASNSWKSLMKTVYMWLIICIDC